MSFGNIYTRCFKVLTMINLRLTRQHQDWPRVRNYRHAPGVGFYTHEDAQVTAKRLCGELYGKDNALMIVQAGPRRWIGDTGTDNDLIGMQSLPQEAIDNAQVLSVPKRLRTAAGPLVVDKQVQLPLTGMSGSANALVLPNTPAAFSIGRK